MNAVRGFALAFVPVLTLTVVLTAQKQAPAPPQTPRQALVEMINGGGKSVMKHLTVEVQQLLSKPENQQAALAMGMFESIRSQAGPDLQVFETGPLLLSVNDAKEHQKIEVNCACFASGGTTIFRKRHNKNAPHLRGALNSHRT